MGLRTSKNVWALLVFLLLISIQSLCKAEEVKLPAVGADLRNVTVSGLSSGGYMAVQFQVAHARLVNGVGVLAAGPYRCAQGDVRRALRNCMQGGESTPPPAWQETRNQIEEYARLGRIDAPEGLLDDRVWVFSGSADRTVDRSVVDALVSFYRSYLPESAVRYVASVNAGHAMLSAFDVQAKTCSTTAAPFINHCDALPDAPGALLTHLFENLRPPVEPKAISLRPFNQAVFTEGHAPGAWSLAERGYVYIPEVCQAGGCSVHVFFHGCQQSESEIGRQLIESAGYNHWAESNRLIILYPQTVARWAILWWGVNNPNGCWDWWGYTDQNYATRDGVQIRAVKAMLDQLGKPAE